MNEPSQQQANRQVKNRTQSGAPPARPASPPPASMPTTAPAGKSAKGQSAFRLEQDQRVAGQAGEQNLNFEWIEVWVGGARSGRFNVTTAADHGLEVTVEQAVYSRSYQGTGRVETSVVPIAPIGTTGKVTARDTTSGEVLLRPYKWIDIDGAGGGGGGLWQLIKRLFGGS